MLRSSIDQKTMMEKSEACLRKLQFEFIRNGTQTLAEYEITKPSYFRVVIESRHDLSVHNFIMPSISAKKGSTLDLRFDIDDYDETSVSSSKASAKLFIQNLVSSLPQEPWRGLGFREEGREAKRWKDLMEGD